MTFIKLSTYVVSTNLSVKRATEKLKDLLRDDILETEDAFNLDFFVEQLCSDEPRLDEDDIEFTLLDQEEAAQIKDIDIEYTDEDIDTLINDVLYSEEQDGDYEEEMDEDLESDDYEDSSDYDD